MVFISYRCRWKYQILCNFIIIFSFSCDSFGVRILWASCPLLLIYASCCWSPIDFLIIKGIDTKCQHVREIVCSQLAFDRWTCTGHNATRFLQNLPTVDYDFIMSILKLEKHWTLQRHSSNGILIMAEMSLHDHWQQRYSFLKIIKSFLPFSLSKYFECVIIGHQLL